MTKATNTTFAPTAKIKVLVENPKNKGSRARKLFDLYKDGMTVGQYTQALTARKASPALIRSTLAWDTSHSYVKIGKAKA